LLVPVYGTNHYIMFVEIEAYISGFGLVLGHSFTPCALGPLAERYGETCCSGLNTCVAHTDPSLTTHNGSSHVNKFGRAGSNNKTGLNFHPMGGCEPARALS
jgi:hypothetical protein